MLRLRFVLLLFLLVFAARAEAADLTGQNAGSNGDGIGLSMALRPDNGVAFSYFNKTSRALRFSEWNGSGWTTSDIDTTLATLAAVTVDGAISYYSQTSLIYVGTVPHVVYYDAAGQRLVHAYRPASSWLKDNIAVTLLSGGAPAAAVCGSQICVSYFNGNSKDMQFAKGNAGSWSISTIESSGDVGSISAVAVKPDGFPAVAYYDATNRRPKVATQAPSGTWTISALSYVNHQFGLFPGIAVGADGTIYTSFSRYRANATNFDTGVYFGRLAPGGSWDLTLVSDDYSGGPTAIRLDGSGKPAIAYRYLRKNSDFGNAAGVKLSTLQPNGTWLTDTVYGEFGFSGSTYNYDNVNLSYSTIGEPRLGYNFDQSLYLSNPALIAIRLHGSAGSGSSTTTSTVTTTTTSVPATTTSSVPATTTSVPTTTTRPTTTTTSVPTTTTTRPPTTTTSIPTTTTRPTTTTTRASTTTTSVATTTTTRPPTTTTRPPTTTTVPPATTSVPTTTTSIPATTTSVPATTTTTSVATTSTTSIATTSTTTTTSSTTTTSILAMTAVRRINGGGSAYLDSAGFVWQKDGWFVGGSKGSRSGAIAGTVDDKLYQTEHAGKAFRYSMPVANGIYMVRLHFAESYYKLPGQRIFNVSLENSPALNGFDILKEVPRYTALYKTFFVAVSDGVLDVGFAGLKNSAKVSAIEVQSLPPDGLMINSGGPTELDSAGQLWIADTGFFGGSTLASAAPITTSATQSVSQSIRYGSYFGYRIPVPNGTYDVVMHFVEPFYDIPGMRIFSCFLEGQNEIPNLDIFNYAGKNKELVLEATSTVNDGILTIDFIPDFAGHTPVVSAIEVHRSDQWVSR